MTGSLVRAPYRSLRGLYGRLLAVAPAFMDVPVDGALYAVGDKSLELRVLGSIDSFRRLELSRLLDASDELIEPSPQMQIICRTDLQAARIVMYLDPEAHPNAYRCASDEVLLKPDQVVTALAFRFLGGLIEQDRHIDVSRIALIANRS